MKVLLIEDDPGDVDLMLEVMEQSKLKLDMSIVADGQQALDYLHRNEEYASAVRPELILLDLNMPRMDGREFLTKIKQDDELKSIPVVVLTTSSAEEDIQRSYFQGASCYITKPVGLKEFTKVVQALDEFWFTVVTFSPGGPEGCG